jgi:hypothetical protein
MRFEVFMTAPTDLDLRHSAFHEGGHVAVALHLGCIVREVYIYDARRSYAGDTKFDITRSETKDSADRKACIVGLSGIAAALKHDPERDPRATGDMDRVRRLLLAFSASSRQALYQEFEGEAFELVTALWPCVSEFAQALQAQSPDFNGRRILNQHEIAEIHSAIIQRRSGPRAYRVTGEE